MKYPLNEELTGQVYTLFLKLLPKNKLRYAVLEISNGERWNIVNNLPDQFGLNIQCALDNYLARADNPSEGEFCNYINSKFPISGLGALVHEDFIESLKSIEDED